MNPGRSSHGSPHRSINSSPGKDISPQVSDNADAYGFSQAKGGHSKQLEGSQPSSEILKGRAPRWGDIDSDNEHDPVEWSPAESARHPLYHDRHGGKHVIDDYAEPKASDVPADDFEDKASSAWGDAAEACHIDDYEAPFSNPALSRQNSTKGVQLRVTGPQLQRQSDSGPSGYGEAAHPGYGNGLQDDNMVPSLKGPAR